MLGRGVQNNTVACMRWPGEQVRTVGLYSRPPCFVAKAANSQVHKQWVQTQTNKRDTTIKQCACRNWFIFGADLTARLCGRGTGCQAPAGGDSRSLLRTLVYEVPATVLPIKHLYEAAASLKALWLLTLITCNWACLLQARCVPTHESKCNARGASWHLPGRPQYRRHAECVQPNVGSVLPKGTKA